MNDVMPELVTNRYETNHHEYEVLPEPQGIVEKIVRSLMSHLRMIPPYLLLCPGVARENVKVAPVPVWVATRPLEGTNSSISVGWRFVQSDTRLRTRGTSFNISSKDWLRGLTAYTINHMKRFVPLSAWSRKRSFWATFLVG